MNENVKNSLHLIEEISKNGRTTFFIMVIACFYVWLTVSKNRGQRAIVSNIRIRI